MSAVADLTPFPCGPRTIRVTCFGGRLISTVRLLVAWPIGGIPHPYETLVFDRDGSTIDAAHYLTRKQAIDGHWHACEVYLQAQ